MGGNILELETERLQRIGYECGVADGYKYGVADGYKRGEEEGVKLGEARYSRLMKILLETDRIDEAQKSINPVSRQILYEKYGIGRAEEFMEELKMRTAFL